MNLSRWVDQLRLIYPRARLTMYDSRASYVNCAIEFEINSDPGSVNCYNTRFHIDRRYLENASIHGDDFAQRVFEDALTRMVAQHIRSVR